MRLQSCEYSCGGDRVGLTLAEVLIALLVMAIGLMGILALYPLGARQMADAIKDERSAQLANAQEGLARIFWRSAMLNQQGEIENEATMFVAHPELNALDSPGGSLTKISKISNGQSYPVFIDPIGYLAKVDPEREWVGYSNLKPGQTQVLPRRSVVLQGNPSLTMSQRLRWFSMLDDIGFTQDGIAPSPLNRGYRYNAAWLLQRAKNNKRDEVNLKVIVYQNRSPDSPSAEKYVDIVTATPGADTFTIALSNAPLFRQGNWLLLSQSTPEPFADFYRVVGVNSNQLTVVPPIRAHGSGSYAANLTLMENVVEVFDRGTLSPFDVPAN